MEGIDLKIFQTFMKYYPKSGLFVPTNARGDFPWLRISNITPMGDYIHITIVYWKKIIKYTLNHKVHDDKIEVVKVIIDN